MDNLQPGDLVFYGSPIHHVGMFVGGGQMIEASHSGTPVRYASIVEGVVAIDMNWAACAARVRGVSGARYRKVRTPEEFAAFCAAYGVEPPPGT